jgi:broad specificity phosphatase PhoE
VPFLILIRHSVPDIDPATPSCEWRLTPEGRDLSRSLARRIGGFQPAAIVTSVEPKARETGEIIAAELGIPCQVRQGLQENDRQGVEVADEGTYRALIADVFAQPDRIVMGRETGEEASDRFHGAVTSVLDGFPDQTIAVVAHGVVMSFFVSRFNPIDIFEFWNRLTLPTAVMLNRDGFRLEGVISTRDLDHVDSDG